MSSSGSVKERVFTIEELKDLNRSENLHLVIHGKVYSISDFIDEHPGGDEVLIVESGGKDATESFEDVGHSDEARKIMEKYYVGTCDQLAPKGSKSNTNKTSNTTSEKKDLIDDKIKSFNDKPSNSSDGGSASGFGFLVPLVVLIAYLSYRFYFGS